MSFLQTELTYSKTDLFTRLDYEKFLNEIAWRFFYKERDAGNFVVKILFFKWDISDIVAEFLTKLVGPDKLRSS